LIPSDFSFCNLYMHSAAQTSSGVRLSVRHTHVSHWNG